MELFTKTTSHIRCVLAITLRFDTSQCDKPENYNIKTFSKHTQCGPSERTETKRDTKSEREIEERERERKWVSESRHHQHTTKQPKYKLKIDIISGRQRSSKCKITISKHSSPFTTKLAYNPFWHHIIPTLSWFTSDLNKSLCSLLLPLPSIESFLSSNNHITSVPFLVICISKKHGANITITRKGATYTISTGRIFTHCSPPCPSKTYTKKFKHKHTA